MMDEALVQAIRQDAFADGVAHEQQRIIELLEDKREKCACYGIGMVVCRHTPTIDETIALIKERTNGAN